MKKPIMSTLKNAAIFPLLALTASAASITSVAAEEGQQLRGRGLEEIVVTARRRQESLQDVPIAVTAFGSTQIKERGIETEADLQMSTPGLVVRATNSSNLLNFAIRGQSVDAFSYSAPAVLAYVNEVQIGGVSSSSFFDLESIQVLKGPQGTLFGRNATGGAVLYGTKQPGDEAGGYIKLGLGNYANREVEGAVNIPLSDSWKARVAGLTRQRDGWQTNLYDGGKLAEIETDNIRVSLSYESDKIQNNLVGYYGEHGGFSEGLKMRNAYNNGDLNPKTGIRAGDLLFATDLYFPGILGTGLLNGDNPRVVELGFDGLADFLQKQQSIGFHEVYNDQPAILDTEHKFLTNSTTFEINDRMSVKNIIGYNKLDSLQVTDIDGSPFMILRQGNETTNDGYFWGTEQISNELQLSGESENGKINYIVGLYYANEKNENRIPLYFAADYPTGILTPAFGMEFAYHAEVEDESKAMFGQVTYAINDKLNFTAGYRHTWEEISVEHFSDSAYFGIAQDDSTKIDKPSWNLSLDYRLNDETLVYASTRGSYRAGGFNLTSLRFTDDGVFPDDFLPEETWDVEVGVKFSGHIGSIPSRVNFAAYEQVVEDAQRTVYLQVTSLSGNVEEAKVTGFELDMQFNLTDWLEVGGIYAYTDARFTKPKGNVAGYDFDFGPYADAPKNTYSIYFRTEHDLRDLGTLSLRGDYYKSSKTYFSNLGDSIGPGTDLASYGLINLRASLSEISGSKYSATIYVRNAVDEEYERGGLPLAGVTGTNATIAGEPRTYGIEISYNF